jgi:hypothetical protein
MILALCGLGLMASSFGKTKPSVQTARKDKWEVFTAHGYPGYKGYRDAVTGVVMLPAQYYLAYPFGLDDWARVLHRDRWHFIDREGNVVLETTYTQGSTSIGNFDSKGYSLVSDNGMWFINRQGDRVIAATFADAEPFQAVRTPDGQSIELAIVAIPIARSATSSVDRLYGAINRQGQFVIAAQFVNFGTFDAQGIANVIRPQINDYKWQFTQQFINVKGDRVGELARRCGQHVLVNAAGKEQLPKTIEADCASWLPTETKQAVTN